MRLDFRASKNEERKIKLEGNVAKVPEHSSGKLQRVCCKERRQVMALK